MGVYPQFKRRLELSLVLGESRWWILSTDLGTEVTASSVFIRPTLGWARGTFSQSDAFLLARLVLPALLSKALPPPFSHTALTTVLH